jgi:hypothetical protein
MKVFYGSSLVAVIIFVGVSSQVRLGVPEMAGPQRISPRPLGITTPLEVHRPTAAAPGIRLRRLDDRPCR